ncbi:uncharacterized protein BJ171DRAFT_507868 [Polychytrium aggregatum]|uniref:uncharacterized protein n=1 Tax=Polychytrium aggregatum TaxID=110093 RepID=UPI0022FDEB38|nr:uncharacterized protein BJ171DRAFT_507868 [Polychytrium aggregatum]KAI9203764.1 hypothetical protein BJ171DRAFT_507868 [Polychytrium aggregatum]
MTAAETEFRKFAVGRINSLVSRGFIVRQDYPISFSGIADDLAIPDRAHIDESYAATPFSNEYTTVVISVLEERDVRSTIDICRSLLCDRLYPSRVVIEGILDLLAKPSNLSADRAKRHHISTEMVLDCFHVLSQTLELHGVVPFRSIWELETESSFWHLAGSFDKLVGSDMAAEHERGLEGLSFLGDLLLDDIAMNHDDPGQSLLAYFLRGPSSHPCKSIERIMEMIEPWLASTSPTVRRLGHQWLWALSELALCDCVSLKTLETSILRFLKINISTPEKHFEFLQSILSPVLKATLADTLIIQSGRFASDVSGKLSQPLSIQKYVQVHLRAQAFGNEPEQALKFARLLTTLLEGLTALHLDDPIWLRENTSALNSLKTQLKEYTKSRRSNRVSALSAQLDILDWMGTAIVQRMLESSQAATA